MRARAAHLNGYIVGFDSTCLRHMQGSETVHKNPNRCPFLERKEPCPYGNPIAILNQYKPTIRGLGTAVVAWLSKTQENKEENPPRTSKPKTQIQGGLTGLGPVEKVRSRARSRRSRSTTGRSEPTRQSQKAEQRRSRQRGHRRGRRSGT